MSRIRKNETKVTEDLNSKAAEAVTKMFQNGDVRAAVFGLIQNVDDSVNTIINAVSQAIVKKLLDNTSFLDKLAKNVIDSGVMNEVKHHVPSITAVRTTRFLTWMNEWRPWKRLTRRYVATVMHKNSIAGGNCLLIHGTPEDQKSATDAVLSLCKTMLGLELTTGYIDGSHRLG